MSIYITKNMKPNGIGLKYIRQMANKKNNKNNKKMLNNIESKIYMMYKGHDNSRAKNIKIEYEKNGNTSVITNDILEYDDYKKVELYIPLKKNENAIIYEQKDYDKFLKLINDSQQAMINAKYYFVLSCASMTTSFICGVLTMFK